MQKNKDEVWEDVLDVMKLTVSSATFGTWISQTHLMSLKKKDQARYIAEIGCGSTYVKTTIESRYFGLVQDTLSDIVGSPTDVNFIIKENPNHLRHTTVKYDTPLFDNNKDDEDFLSRLSTSKIRIGFTFENFAVSGSNQMAHAAAEAISQSPGTAYNPLFIYGGVGVGKTHLMHSVGYVMLKKNQLSRVLACTGETFTNDIVEGIRNKSTRSVRDKYRRLEGLFIDDVQFIAGKEKVQEEFFHTFNAVTSAGGQVILTSDRPPAEIPKLEERLSSRFEAGLIVDIAPPDFELRCAIVEIKSEERNIKLEKEIVHLIAGNIESPRKIEGLLVKLSSEIKFRNLDVTEENVMSIIQKGECRILL